MVVKCKRSVVKYGNQLATANIESHTLDMYTHTLTQTHVQTGTHTNRHTRTRTHTHTHEPSKGSPNSDLAGKFCLQRTKRTQISNWGVYANNATTRHTHFSIQVSWQTFLRPDRGTRALLQTNSRHKQGLMTNTGCSSLIKEYTD